MIDQTLYEKYLKAALKFTFDPKKLAHLSHRPALEGVLHHEDGSLIASDSIRMIRIQDAHNRQAAGAVLTKASKDVSEFSFPDLTKLLNPNLDVSVEDVNIADWIKGHELMDILVADRVDVERDYVVDGNKKKKVRLKNHVVRLALSRGIPSVLTANYAHVGSGRHEFSEKADGSMQIAYNAQLVIEALKILKTLGHSTCTFRFKSAGTEFSTSPFVMEAGNVWILQLPVRG